MQTKATPRARIAAVALAVSLLMPGALSAAGERSADAEVFAVVGSVVLSANDFKAAFSSAARTKFYHSRPPEEALAAFQREVGDELINRVLAVQEAKRRGLKPDAEYVKAQLARYEARSKHAPNWDGTRGKLLAAMTEQFEHQNLHEQLERAVRAVPAPSEAQLRAYYDQHKDRFVEPEQVRLSVILLKVDPGAPKESWEAAREEARRIHKQLAGGADFAALAGLHSGDPTAQKGGDMGYVHRGMLPEAVHAVVDKLKPRESAEPVTLLEGIAILRLEDRKPSQQRALEDVRDRARDLWQRAESDARWKKLLADLRKRTPIKINESHYLPMNAQKDRAS